MAASSSRRGSRGLGSDGLGFPGPLRPPAGGSLHLGSLSFAAHMSGWRRHLVGIQMFVASRCPPSSVPPSNSPLLWARGWTPRLSVRRAFL